MASNPISVLPIVGSGVFELCVFENGKPKYVGYYDDPAAADKYIADHSKEGQSYNVFITSQKLNPTLIQKSHNKTITTYERTKDSEVLGYRYLLIDLDANQKMGDQIVHRPSGVSASDEEHDAAITLARHIVHEIGLKDENYLLIDSGNGAHIYIPVEEGIQEPAIKAAINGLKIIYDTELVQVDPAVFNPASAP